MTQSGSDATRPRHIVVLTGAGVSVASGLRPYRGPGGLWTEAAVGKLADVKAKYAGARTVLINLEPMAPANAYYDDELLGRAEELLPGLLA